MAKFGYMLLIITLTVVLLALVVASIEIVPENTVYVVENLGKFRGVMTAGLNFRLPLIESVAERVPLKQQNFSLAVRYPTKDKVMVNLACNLIFEVIPTTQAVSNYVYKLADRNRSIAGAVENSLRAFIGRGNSQEVLEKKDDLITYMRQSLGGQFKDWGINIVDFQIIEINPSQSVSW